MWKLKTLFKIRIESEANTPHVRILSIPMVKTICGIWHTQEIEAENKGDKDGKALYKLMNNTVAIFSPLSEDCMKSTNMSHYS